MRFAPLTPDTFGVLNDLFVREKGVIRTHQQPAYLPWSFLDVPHQPPQTPVCELVVEDSQAIGCMGAIPHTLLLDGMPMPFAAYVDWLVDSSQRRRGIGSQLIERANARFPAAVHLGSTPVGYATCATLGAVDCGQTLSARRILRPRRWARGAQSGHRVLHGAWIVREAWRERRRPRLAHADCRVTPVAPDDVDDDLRRLSAELSQSHVCTQRDAARWNWLLNSPLYAGYAVAVDRGAARLGYAACVLAYRSQRLVGTVADVCAGRPEHLQVVLTAALVDLAHHGPDGIEFTLSEPVGRPVAAALGMTVLRTPRMGAWLQPGYEHVVDRPFFMSMAENLSVTAGIDYPVRVPTV